MNIYAEYGDKVVYTGENGYEIDRTHLESFGVGAGDILTVHSTDVGDSSTSVHFLEIPSCHNSVMFEDVE